MKKNFRKPLSKNRHGIELSVRQAPNNTFTRPLEYDDKVGKYCSKV